MQFSKYHGIGNDFILFADPEDRIELSSAVAARLCDRRFGIGADGVIRMAPGRDGADLFMDYYNSDGSIGEMCGNGIRCLALFARDEGLVDADQMAVATRSGVKLLQVAPDGRVRVDMGAPVFDPTAIPVHWNGPDALHVKLDLEAAGGGAETVPAALPVIEATCLSMGNPHVLLFTDDLDTAPVTTLGPVLEHHPAFPNGTNVEWVLVESPGHIRVRVWERGSGETLACGTGACAAAVAARLLHGTRSTLAVTLPGGELDVFWEGSLTREAAVVMTGPAVKTFGGDVDLEAYR